MATMGQGKVSKKKGVGSDLVAPVIGLSIIIPMLQVDSAATVAVGSTLGIPIMREGFITETGFLPSSSAPISVVSTII